MRAALVGIDNWERGMKLALYGNGMIGGDDLTKEIDSIQMKADELRALATGADIEEGEEEFTSDAPYPATAEAEPVGT